MYKDKDKQREAQRNWVRQKRAAKGSTDTLRTDAESLQHKSGTDTMSAKAVNGKPNQMTVMERLFYRPAHLLKPGETNFVSLPGRAC